MAKDTFLDPNGDSMTYDIPEETPLPSWLSFNPSKRRFTGTPTEYS